MNGAIKAGEVFRLAELVPYAEGKIVNMDMVHNDKMKFVAMSFDEGTGLSEHAAPGEALIFALDSDTKEKFTPSKPVKIFILPRPDFIS